MRTRCVRGRRSSLRRLGRDLYVGGRLGVATEGNLLIYAKAGYTRLSASADYDAAGSSGLDEDEIDELLEDEDLGRLDGVRVGAGLEASFMTRGLAKIEYRYSNYEADVTRHQVVVGLGIRF
jgi:outer membrane immunogenic protein